MRNDPYVPMPDTCHPFYERQADTLRTGLDLPSLNVAIPRPVAAFTIEPGEMSPTSAVATDFLVLTVKKCAAPAPFIGDALREQAHYTWRVAVDDFGRHVAGSATLEVAQRTAWLR